MSRSAATLIDLVEATSVIVSEVAFVRGIQLTDPEPSPIMQLVREISDQRKTKSIVTSPRSVEELRELRRRQGRPERISRPWNTYGMKWQDSTP